MFGRAARTEGILRDLEFGGSEDGQHEGFILGQNSGGCDKLSVAVEGLGGNAGWCRVWCTHHKSRILGGLHCSKGISRGAYTTPGVSIVIMGCNHAIAKLPVACSCNV